MKKYPLYEILQFGLTKEEKNQLVLKKTLQKLNPKKSKKMGLSQFRASSKMSSELSILYS